MIHTLREGLGCETVSLWHKDRDLQGVDMVVLGGYGHARLRELVLGGVTRDMLRVMTVPLFMSH